jgi:hypothetical protein
MFAKENTGHQGLLVPVLAVNSVKHLEDSVACAASLTACQADLTCFLPQSQKFPCARHLDKKTGKTAAVAIYHRCQTLYPLIQHRRFTPTQASAIAMSLAAPGLLPKAATPLRILAASRPTCQTYSERPQSTIQSRHLYTAPSTRSARHAPRQPAQIRVSESL